MSTPTTRTWTGREDATLTLDPAPDGAGGASITVAGAVYALSTATAHLSPLDLVAAGDTIGHMVEGETFNHIDLITADLATVNLLRTGRLPQLQILVVEAAKWPAAGKPAEAAIWFDLDTAGRDAVMDLAETLSNLGRRYP